METGESKSRYVTIDRLEIMEAVAEMDLGEREAYLLALAVDLFRGDASKAKTYCGRLFISKADACRIGKSRGGSNKIVATNLQDTLNLEGDKVKVKVKDKVKDKDKDKEKEKENKVKSDGAKRFAPPSIQELVDYQFIHSLDFDPQAFFDYYQSVGWTVGKGRPMKDWPAAVRNWIRTQKRFDKDRPAGRQLTYQERIEISLANRRLK